MAISKGEIMTSNNKLLEKFNELFSKLEKDLSDNLDMDDQDHGTFLELMGFFSEEMVEEINKETNNNE